MVLRLTNGQPRVVSVPAAPFVVRVFLNQLPASEIGTVEGDDKFVLGFLPQDRGHVHPLGDEHVFCLEDSFAIEDDRGEGIEAVKGQDGFGSIGNSWGGKLGFIDPYFLADPLNVELVLADVRVWDDLVMEEVEVNVGRELGDS